MTYDVLLALFIFTFVASVTPGPNNVMLLASGLNFGVKRTLPHMFGIAIGFMVMVFCVGLGLGQMFKLFPLLFTIMKIAGLVYMLWLAWNVANSGPVGEGEMQGRPMTFMEAALFQWVNPKAWIMTVSATASYSDPANYLTSVITIVLIFGITNFPSISIWVFAGVGLRRFLNDPVRLRIVNIIMALLLVTSLYPIVIDLAEILRTEISRR
jgi:threonine/homoserine/homoserine lactone efflux protein